MASHRPAGSTARCDPVPGARATSGATTRRLRYRPDMAAASGRTSGHSDVSIVGGQLPGRHRQRREPEKMTWRCLNRLSLSSAWLAPLIRGSLNSAHIRGTDVPVEEPSTASNSEVGGRNREVRCAPDCVAKVFLADERN